MTPPLPPPGARRIVVTGAAGFIGYHVAERLLAAGDTVLGLDNLNAYYPVALKEARLARLEGRPGFAFDRADLADGDRLLRTIADFQPHAVVNLAAQAGVRHSIREPHAYARSNLAGFLNVLEACRHAGIGHLVYASSSSVYGQNAKVPFSEHDGVDHPVSLYAATKRANELMAHSYAHLYGLPATGLRFFTVYGPWGRPDMAYFSFTRAILAGEPIDVFAGGTFERDFTYIDDIAEAVVRLIGVPPAPDPGYDRGRADPAASWAPFRLYNIGNHTPVTVNAFIGAIERACGRKALRRDKPAEASDVPKTFADVDDLAKAIGFAPATPLEVGICRFVEWYRGYNGL